VAKGLNALGLNAFSRDLAVDLGTANTLVYVDGKGIMLEEPSVVAVQQGRGGVLGEVVSVGSDAREMLGRTPGNIIAVRPLKNGVITDFRIAEAMLRSFIHKAAGSKGFFKPRILACVPSGVSEVEKRAVYESARAAGGREVYLLSEPIAAALGAGLPVMEATGCMVVDIGGGTTEVAVIAMGAIVKSASIKVAGDQMDQSIALYLKEQHNLLIGEISAEHLKVTLGCAVPYPTPREGSIKGRDAQTGIPKEVRLTDSDIGQALAQPIKQILDAIQQTLAATPPELAADILDRGIVLCGGGAQLFGLTDVIHEKTGVDCAIDSDPLRCVVRGAGMALENTLLLNRVAMA
jgi:rod shape-determining protein MreB